MAQVVVELNGKEVAREHLKGPSLVIGRDASVDIHLDNRALSRRHAQIEKRGAAIWIRDLGSQNGTFVNGRRMEEPQPLNAGDIIEVGRYQLHIDGVEEARADTPVLTLTVSLGPAPRWASKKATPFTPTREAAASRMTRSTRGRTLSW